MRARGWSARFTRPRGAPTNPADRFRRRTLPLIAALFAAGLLGGVLARPLAAACGGPSLRVALAAETDRSGKPRVLGAAFGTTGSLSRRKEELDARDDWGARIVSQQSFKLGRGGVLTPQRLYYSKGPNGQDDEGLGDDVRPAAWEWLLAKWLGQAGWALFAVCGGLAFWWVTLLHTVKQRSDRRELALALVIALPPGGALWLAGTLLARPWSEQIAKVQWTALPVHWEVLAFFSTWGACYLITVAIRLQLAARGVLPELPTAEGEASSAEVERT